MIYDDGKGDSLYRKLSYKIIDKNVIKSWCSTLANNFPENIFDFERRN